MFTDRDNAGQAAAAGDYPPAELSLAHVVGDGGASRKRHTRAASTLAETTGNWRAALSAKLSRADLAPDLGADIGSRRWLRGVATLIGLSAIAIAGWPGFSAV